MFTLAHTADLHATMKEAKQSEVERTCDAFANEVKRRGPDLVVLAGDTFDEADGKITIDSRPARYVISLVERLAMVAPVAIVRGTHSHDRDTPYILRHIKTENPVYVATQVEMIGLYQTAVDHKKYFAPLDTGEDKLIAAITFFPSPDKTHMINVSGDSIMASNLNAGEALHDAMVAIGGFNESLEDRDIPRIMVGHGMITGAEYSSGTVAVGEDLEFTVGDLQKANCDVVCFGHVHKHQVFRGNIVYSGSPGRLNFGETEEKGFCLIEIQ